MLYYYQKGGEDIEQEKEKRQQESKLGKHTQSCYRNPESGNCSLTSVREANQLRSDGGAIPHRLYDNRFVAQCQTVYGCFGLYFGVHQPYTVNLRNHSFHQKQE